MHNGPGSTSRRHERGGGDDEAVSMANVTVRRGGSGDCGGTDGEGEGEGGSDEAGGGIAAPAL